jgi:tetratricopeptide (TPR) repeat protein
MVDCGFAVGAFPLARRGADELLRSGAATKEETAYYQGVRTRAQAVCDAATSLQQLWRQGRRADAVSKLRAFAAQHEGRVEEAWALDHAAAYLALDRRREEAIRACRQLARRFPGTRFATLAEARRAQILANQGRYVEALQLARRLRATTKWPEDRATALTTTAEILRRRGDGRGALQALAEARRWVQKCEPASLRSALGAPLDRMEAQAKRQAGRKGA